MATDLERLVVQFSADFKRLENETKRSNALFSRQMRQMERQADASVKRINSALGGVGRVGTLAKGFLAGVSAAAVKNYIDSALRIENALKVAGLSGQELDRVYLRLFASAQKNAAPLETLVTLYGRAALAQKELNVTQEEMLSFTNNVAMALRVSGTSAEEARGALIQLSQAIGAGIVRAEEFNSILEGALPIAQAAARGIKEAGGSVAQLRKLIIDGKVSSEAFFKGFQAGAPILEQKLSGAVLTIDQRLTNLKTSLIDAAKRFNNSSQAANTFGSAIDNVANYVNTINFDALIGEINRLMNAFVAAQNIATNFANDIGSSLGLDNVGKFLTGGQAQSSYLGGALTITSQKVIQDRISGAFDGITPAIDNAVSDALKKKYGGKQPQLPKVNEAVNSPNFKPISLEDYAVYDAKGKKAGGGRAKRTPVDRFDDEVRRANDRTAALVAETEAMRQLNPLIDDYGYAMEKARTEQELLNAAQKAGVAITPELRAQITQTAEQWALATAEANKLAEAQDKIRQRAEEWRDTAQDATRGFVDDLMNGVSAAEALASALDKVLSKLLDMAFDDIFSGLFKGGGGGIFGGLFRKDGGPVKAATGGLIRGPGGPRTDSIPAMLSDGEYVINAKATKQNRALLEAINGGRSLALAGGGMASLKAPSMPTLQAPQRQSGMGRMAVDVGVTVDNDGNLQAYVKSVSRQESASAVKAYDKSGPMRFARDSKQANRWGLVR